MIYIRKAAEQATAGLGGAREVIRPGITEIELAGEIEWAMRGAGSEFFEPHGTTIIWTWLSAVTRSIGDIPRSRALVGSDGICASLEHQAVAVEWVVSTVYKPHPASGDHLIKIVETTSVY